MKSITAEEYHILNQWELLWNQWKIFNPYDKYTNSSCSRLGIISASVNALIMQFTWISVAFKSSVQCPRSTTASKQSPLLFHSYSYNQQYFWNSSSFPEIQGNRTFVILVLAFRVIFHICLVKQVELYVISSLKNNLKKLMMKYCLIPDFYNRRPHPRQKIVMYSFLNQRVNLVSLTIILLMNFKLPFDTDREFLELQHPISEQRYVGDG